MCHVRLIKNILFCASTVHYMSVNRIKCTNIEPFPCIVCSEWPYIRNILAFFQVHPEGKFVVDLDKNIDINDVTANARVALRNDSYTLHKILPSKVRESQAVLHWIISYFVWAEK